MALVVIITEVVASNREEAHILQLHIDQLAENMGFDEGMLPTRCWCFFLP